MLRGDMLQERVFGHGEIPCHKGYDGLRVPENKGHGGLTEDVVREKRGATGWAWGGYYCVGYYV